MFGLQVLKTQINLKDLTPPPLSLPLTNPLLLGEGKGKTFVTGMGFSKPLSFLTFQAFSLEF